MFFRIAHHNKGTDIPIQRAAAILVRNDALKDEHQKTRFEVTLQQTSGNYKYLEKNRIYDDSQIVTTRLPQFTTPRTKSIISAAIFITKKIEKRIVHIWRERSK